MATSEQALAGELLLGAPRGISSRVLSSLASFARRKPIGAACAVFLVVIFIMAIAAPLIATHDPTVTDTPNRLLSPRSGHILGTDHLGRDIWSQLVHGARVSLYIGYGGMAIALLVGTTIALTSGYFGGRVDLVLQRGVDSFQAMPGLLVIMSIVTILEPSILTLTLTLGVLFGIGESRVIRSSVLAIKGMPYVDAAKAMGASPWRVILRHILPNIVAIIIVLGSINVARIILVEATLSFLGFGIPPPDPTWGQMLSGATTRFMILAPWMAIAPAVALSLTVLAFNLFGDALRDVLDPRLRGT